MCPPGAGYVSYQLNGHEPDITNPVTMCVGSIPVYLVAHAVDAIGRSRFQSA
jgi:hypothetical protein